MYLKSSNHNYIPILRQFPAYNIFLETIKSILKASRLHQVGKPTKSNRLVPVRCHDLFLFSLCMTQVEYFLTEEVLRFHLITKRKLNQRLGPIRAMAVGPLSQDELDEIYAFAVDLGRKAGKLLMDRVEQRISGSERHSQDFEEKDNAVDIVTQTDEGAYVLS